MRFSIRTSSLYLSFPATLLALSRDLQSCDKNKTPDINDAEPSVCSTTTETIKSTQYIYETCTSTAFPSDANTVTKSTVHLDITVVKDYKPPAPPLAGMKLEAEILSEANSVNNDDASPTPSNSNETNNKKADQATLELLKKRSILDHAAHLAEDGFEDSSTTSTTQFGDPTTTISPQSQTSSTQREQDNTTATASASQTNAAAAPGVEDKFHLPKKPASPPGPSTSATPPPSKGAAARNSMPEALGMGGLVFGVVALGLLV